MGQGLAKTEACLSYEQFKPKTYDLFIYIKIKLLLYKYINMTLLNNQSAKPWRGNKQLFFVCFLHMQEVEGHGIEDNVHWQFFGQDLVC